MRIEDILNEEMKYANDGKYIFKLLTNPRKQELMLLSKTNDTVKIIADSKERKFYVFPDDISFNKIKSSLNNSLWLNGEIENGKVYINSFDTYFLNINQAKRTLKKIIGDINNWRWTDTYSDLTNFLKSQF